MERSVTTSQIKAKLFFNKCQKYNTILIQYNKKQDLSFQQVSIPVKYCYSVIFPVFFPFPFLFFSMAGQKYQKNYLFLELSLREFIYEVKNAWIKCKKNRKFFWWKFEAVLVFVCSTNLFRG